MKGHEGNAFVPDQGIAGLRTGDVKWTESLGDWGSLMAADGKLIIVDGQGDLIIAEAYFDWPPMQRLLRIIRGDAFKARVAELGGYHTDLTGKEL